MELKVLENLQPRKFNRNYVEKFVSLLHESKDLHPKYSIQRRKLKLKPIKNMKSINNRGREIYITLSKDNNAQNKNPLYKSNETDTIPFPQYLIDEEQNNLDDTNKNNNNYINDSIVTDSVRDILYKKTDNNIDSNLYEEKEKLLYQILKTKKQFHKKNKYRVYSSTETNETNGGNNSLLITKNRRKNFMSPNFIRNFDESLSRSIEKKNLKKLTENQVKKLYYISELKLFDSFDEISKKNKILNKIKNDHNGRYLNNLEMFNYDKNKWDKKRNELNKNVYNIMCNKINSENKKYLNHMRKSVDKLHDNANYINKDLGKFINDLHIFIEKNTEYINKDNQSNKGSRVHSKRGTFRKKTRKSTQNSINSSVQ